MQLYNLLNPPASGPPGTNWPAYIVINTNFTTAPVFSTANASTYATAAYTLKSNNLYLAGVTTTKASGVVAPSMTNQNGTAWTLVGFSNYTVTAKGLSVFCYQTNSDQASQTTTVTGPSQTGCNLAILCISNAACGDLRSNGLDVIVQGMFAKSDGSANPGVTLGSAISSGSNAVVVVGGDSLNATAGAATENRVTDFTGGYNTPATSLWMGHDTTFPVSDTSVTITWATASNCVWAGEIKAMSIAAPSIRVQPVASSVGTNSTATFTCIATNGPDIGFTYQWRTNGVNIGDGGIVSGSTSTVLTYTGVNTNYTGLTNDCVVVNAFGSVTSSPAMLTVSEGLASYETQSCTTNMEAQIGQQYSITAEAFQFVASSTGTRTAVIITNMYRVGTLATQTLTAQLYTNNPTGPVPSTAIGTPSSTVACSSLSTDPAATVTFTGMNCSVISGGTYWLVVTISAMGDVSNYVDWLGGDYTGNNAYNAADTWTFSANRKANFTLQGP
jgi:hypothetical protein